MDRFERLILKDTLPFMLGLFNLGVGLCFMLGNPLRTSGPSLAVARQAMPISYWGMVFAVAGVICWQAPTRGRLGAVLFSTASVLPAWWALQIAQSAARDQHATINGIWVYTWFTFLHLLGGMRLAFKVRR